jgi:hypothetical protein
MLLKNIIEVYKNYSTSGKIYTTFTGACKKNKLNHNTLKAYTMPFEYFDKKSNTHYRFEKKEVIR